MIANKTLVCCLFAYYSLNFNLYLLYKSRKSSVSNATGCSLP